jgi:hypothetical protein
MIKLSKRFWDDLEAKYPAGMEHYYKWLHAYKESVGWTKLFRFGKGESFSYFDLPIAMQLGIFMQYASEQNRSIDLGTVNNLKQFYQLSAKIENYLAGAPVNGPQLDQMNPLGLLGLARVVIGTLPGEGIDDGGSFEGGGGEFDGGGASGKW